MMITHIQKKISVTNIITVLPGDIMLTIHTNIVNHMRILHMKPTTSAIIKVIILKITLKVMLDVVTFTMGL